MSFGLECRKIKGTGFLALFLWGGLLSAAVPILNMAFRSEIYLKSDASPVQILMDANWQLMSMLNLLLVVTGSCLMYHTEYADGAMQKMQTLPLRESRLFFGKAALLTIMCILILGLEAAGICFCLCRWFIPSAELLSNAMMQPENLMTPKAVMPPAVPLLSEVLINFGYALLLLLPAAFGSLLIASFCKNMWISLGIGVICILTATMLPAKNFVLSLFPFALPFRIFAGTAQNSLIGFSIAAVVEAFVIGIIEILFLKIRRKFT
ncbi:MAG: ABC transporter permease [Butyrivibrio sp.]|nr:ABC transporter permease [Acetatifactor muris]MCM1558857.1 ABC transporter permease [Butyrivibrio sp.]